MQLQKSQTPPSGETTTTTPRTNASASATVCSTTPIPGSCSGQTLVLQNPLACRRARCQNQGPQNRHTCSSTQILGETGSVVVMKNRMCQNDGLGDYVLSASLLLTAILAVLSQPGVECGQPPVRSSIQRKMGGGQATSKEAP